MASSIQNSTVRWRIGQIWRRRPPAKATTDSSLEQPRPPWPASTQREPAAAPDAARPQQERRSPAAHDSRTWPHPPPNRQKLGGGGRIWRVPSCLGHRHRRPRPISISLIKFPRKKNTWSRRAGPQRPRPGEDGAEARHEVEQDLPARCRGCRRRQGRAAGRGDAVESSRRELGRRKLAHGDGMRRIKGMGRLWRRVGRVVLTTV